MSVADWRGGLVFLEKGLFVMYSYAPSDEEANAADQEPPTFQISLSSLLETLQIFGINENRDRWSGRDATHTGFLSRGGHTTAFDNRTLGLTGVCRLSYAAPGDPLRIVLEESGVTTTCELATYEPQHQEPIPLQRDALCQKIIMRASWLHDAINELSSTSPTRLKIVASPTPPYFTLSSTGPFGSAAVEFSKDPDLLETFQVPKRTSNSYKYSLIKAASRAMATATKVSIRGDEQGVLSLQFMIETEGGNVSFVDFRFVPFLLEEGDEDEEPNAEA